jgi:hypothetical protein
MPRDARVKPRDTIKKLNGAPNLSKRVNAKSALRSYFRRTKNRAVQPPRRKHKNMNECGSALVNTRIARPNAQGGTAAYLGNAKNRNNVLYNVQTR